VSILPELFDGRGRTGEAQGCRVMVGKGISHDHDALGSPDQPGISPIGLGVPCDGWGTKFPTIAAPLVNRRICPVSQGPH